MKLTNILLLSVGAAFFAIGIYEVIQTPDTGNIIDNYWIFMVSLLCLFILGYRKLQKTDNK